MHELTKPTTPPRVAIRGHFGLALLRSPSLSRLRHGEIRSLDWNRQLISALPMIGVTLGSSPLPPGSPIAYAYRTMTGD
jgi:hypothetical protein